MIGNISLTTVDLLYYISKFQWIVIVFCLIVRELYKIDKKLKTIENVEMISLGIFKFPFFFYERKKGLMSRIVFRAYLWFYTYIIFWLGILIVTSFTESNFLSLMSISINLGIFPFLLIYGIYIDKKVKRLETNQNRII